MPVLVLVGQGTTAVLVLAAQRARLWRLDVRTSIFSHPLELQQLWTGVPSSLGGPAVPRRTGVPSSLGGPCSTRIILEDHEELQL